MKLVKLRVLPLACLLFGAFLLVGCSNRFPGGDDDTTLGDATGDDDDDSGLGDDDSEAGDDDSGSGDDDSGLGDDDSEAGDDDSEAGDDDSEAGDDDSESGDDDSDSGGAPLCPAIGVPCSDVYSEQQVCAATGVTVTVQCHKFGECQGIGDGTQCSWGPGSWCEDPCTPSLPGGGSAVGQVFGVNVDPANPAGNPSAGELISLGARWVRIEWKVSHDFAFYDPVIAALRAAGIQVLLLVDYASVSGSPGSSASAAEWSVYRSVFNQGLATIAQHYGDSVDAWQVWNEPDLFAPGSGYDPGVPAAEYGPMLEDSVTTIRGFSSRPVVTGGLASGNPAYLTSVVASVGGLTVDAVAVHPYGQRPGGYPDSTWGFGEMADLFDAYLAVGLPLWVTEIGANSTDQSWQSGYLEATYELVEQDYPSTVLRVFWFCWSDGMVTPFGLLDSAGTPKTSYSSYQAQSPPW